MKDEIFKQAYDFEVDQMRHLDSKVNVPIIGVTAVGGALASILSQFNYGSDWITYLFVVFTALTTMMLIITIFLIFRSLSFFYHYNALASKRLFNFYAKENATEENASCTKDFLDAAVITLLVDATDRNRLINNDRARYLALATLFLSFSLIFLGPGTGIYLVNHIGNKKQQVMTTTLSTQKQKQFDNSCIDKVPGMHNEIKTD